MLSAFFSGVIVGALFGLWLMMLCFDAGYCLPKNYEFWKARREWRVNTRREKPILMRCSKCGSVEETVVVGWFPTSFPTSPTVERSAPVQDATPTEAKP